MRILLFARARDLAGAEAVEVEVPHQATVGDLRRGLKKQFPQLAGLMDRSALAVNNEYATDALPLPLDAEVALVPPVSGG